MRWLIRGTTVLMLIVVSIYGIGALILPDEKRIERRIDIAASPAAVFTVVNDMRAFNDWSPWAQIDEATIYRFDGPREGLGAAMSWSSEMPRVGKGSQVIVASEPNERVRMRLQFGESNTAMAELLIEPAERGTQVTWALEMDFNGSIVQRYIGALILEGAVQRDYERGLTNLKRLLETGS
jgi:uncharacterized protein YndB with AHSA1/START domain